MQIVIEIDEKLYKDIYSDAEIMIYGGMRSGKTLLATLLRAIRNGTPLPKGHGDLVDFDKLCEEYWDGNYLEIHCDDLASIQPIIEADKAESEEEE